MLSRLLTAFDRTTISPSACCARGGPPPIPTGAPTGTKGRRAVAALHHRRQRSRLADREHSRPVDPDGGGIRRPAPLRPVGFAGVELTPCDVPGNRPGKPPDGADRRCRPAPGVCRCVRSRRRQPVRRRCCIPVPSADAAGPDAPPVANPVAAIALASLTATRERPLFSPSRSRPRAAPVAAAPVVVAAVTAPPPERPAVTLSGVVIAAGVELGSSPMATRRSARARPKPRAAGGDGGRAEGGQAGEGRHPGQPRPGAALGGATARPEHAAAGTAGGSDRGRPVHDRGRLNGALLSRPRPRRASAPA